MALIRTPDKMDKQGGPSSSVNVFKAYEPGRIALFVNPQGDPDKAAGICITPEAAIKVAAELLSWAVTIEPAKENN